LAGTIKGIVIDIGGNTAPLDKALQGVNKTSKDLQTELKQVEKLLKLDPTNTELLAQKQKLLADSVENTKGKLDTLKEAEKQVQQQIKEGKVSEEQYRALQREVVATEQKMQGLESQAKQTNAVLSKDDAVKNLKNIGLAAGATAVAAGAAFVAMGVSELENADKIQTTADIYGLTAERVQELTYVGTKLDVELDTITKAQSLLTKNMYLAKDGTGAQADAFNALGISIVDSNGNLRDGKTVMDETITALGKLPNETERDAVAMKLFGKSAMELNPLIKAGGDEIARLSEEARKSGAVLSNESIEGLDGFKDSADALKLSVQGLIGNALAGMLPQLQGLLNNLIELPKWIEKNKTLLEIIGIAIGTLTTAIIAYNIAAGWAAITTGIMTTATAAFGAVLAFVTSPITIIILAIGALIAVGVLLYKNWDTIKETCSVVWNFIVGIFNGVIDFVKNNWQALLLMIVNPFAGAFKLLYDNCEGFRNFIDNFVEGIKQAFANAWNSIVSFFTETIPKWIAAVIKWFDELPYNLGLAIGKMIGSIIQFGIDAWKWITTELPKIITGIIDWFKELPGKIWDTLVLIVTKIAEFQIKILNWIAENFPKIISSIIDFFKELPSKIWNAIMGIIDKLIELKDSMINWIVTELPNFINKFVEFMQQLPAKMLDIGKNIVTGIWNGITGMASWLWDKVTDFVSGIVDGVKGALGINSPSQVLADEVGKYMAQGIGVGFESEMGSVSTSMAKSIPTTKGDYATVASSTGSSSTSSSIASEILNGLYDLFEAMPQQAVDLNVDGTKFGRVLLPKLIAEKQRLGLSTL
jgi:phage-related minor tail protein